MNVKPSNCRQSCLTALSQCILVGGFLLLPVWGVAIQAQIQTNVIGTVRSAPDGIPLYGAQVFVDPTGNWAAPAYSAQADRQGGYAFTDLPAGEYLICAQHPFRAPDQTNVFLVEGVEVTQDFWLEPAAMVQGSVSDMTDHLPIEGAEITITRQATPTNEVQVVQTDSFGFYHLPQMPSGAYEIFAAHPAYRQSPKQQVALAPGSRAISFQLERRLDSASRTEVHVQLLCAMSGLQITGAPVHLKVYVDPSGTGAYVYDAVAWTGPRGSVVFRGVPFGYLKLTANMGGAGQVRTWWNGFAPNEVHRLNRPKQVTFRLEPFKRSVKVRLTPQEDWMNQQPYRSMYCQNFWIELAGTDGTGQTYPPRTGLTDYDGQAMFHEIPTVPFRLVIRRPGFNLRELVVTPDAEGDFPTQIDLARPDIRQGAGLRATLDVPGFVSFDNNGETSEAGEGPGGITLQGMKDSNTDGFFKYYSLQSLTAPMVVDFRDLSGTAWPGTYILSGSGFFSAPFDGSDGCHYSARIEYSIPPTTITIIDRTNVITEIRIPMEIKKPEVNGSLLTADLVVGERHNLVYRPVPNKTIEFMVHEELAPWVAPEHRSVRTKTDSKGDFHITLLPIPYGIRLPDQPGEVSMANRWGERMLWGTIEMGWPYPQRVPNGWQNLFTLSGDYIEWGYQFRSDVNAKFTLLTRRRDQFNVRGFIRHQGVGSALRERVVYVKEDDTALTVPTDDLLEAGSYAQLRSHSGVLISNRVHVYNTNLSYLFTNLPAGEFSLEAPHVHYLQTNVVAFTNFQWGAPGYLPASPPPMYEALSKQHVLMPMEMNLFQLTGDKVAKLVEKSGFESNVTVRIWWIDNEQKEHSYDVSPLFVRCPDYGMQLFKYNGLVHRNDMSVIVLHTANDMHKYFETNGRVVVAYESQPISLNTSPFTLEVRSRQEAMRELEVTNLSFKIRSDNTVYVTPKVFTNYTGNAILQGAGTNSVWTWKHVDYELDPGAISPPRVISTIYANLNFDLRGRAIDETTLEGLPQAEAYLLRADGGRIESYKVEVSADASGNFLFSNLAEGFRDFFVDVSCPGYLPARVRFSPGTPPAYTGSRPVYNLSAPVALKALRTVVTNTVLNRCGYILGGVRAVGRGGSPDALEMTWSTQVTPFSGSLQQLNFDNPDGSPNAPSLLTYTDRIKEVWLINARANFFSSDDMTIADRDGAPMLPYATNLPSAEQYPRNKRRLPNPNNPAAVWDWLQDIEEGTGFYPVTGASRELSAQTVFYQKIPVTAGLGQTCTVTGKIKVADLPRGEFLPCVAVVTENGAAQYVSYVFTNHNQKPLNVLRIPTWLAFAADVMTVAGDTVATAKELKELKDTIASSVPDGKISALPDYSASILEQDGYLTYQYQLAVKWLEGSEMPGGDLLGLAPGVLGLEFSSDALIEFEGKTPSIALELGGRLGSSDIDLKDLIPSIAEKLDIEGQITDVSGQARTKRRSGLQGDDWTDFVLTTQVGANMEGYIRYNLAGLTSKIPYIGPALFIADKAGLLKFWARADAAARVDSIETWRTQEPERKSPAYLIGEYIQVPAPAPEIKPPANADDDQALTPQRHEFGGLREVTILKTNYLALGFNFGASLEAEADAKLVRLYGRAGIELTGDETTGTVLGKPSLRVVLNPYGDWPVVKRVTGQANLTLTALADLTITEIGKTWSWPLVTIDQQFGTTNTMNVVDLGLRVWRRDKDYPPVQLVNDGPVLLSSCLPMQRYCATGNGLAYLSFDRHRGLMTLMVSFQDAGVWSPPLEIAAAAHIADIEMAQLPAPDSRWLVLWGEVPSEDLPLAYPRCLIKSSLLDQGVWTSPATVTQLEGQLRELDLVIGPVASAVYLENPNTADSVQTRICASAFASNAWSVPYGVREFGPIAASAVAGTGTTNAVPARIAVVNGSNSVDSLSWDGVRSVAPGGAEHLSVDSGPVQAVLALGSGIDQEIYAAYVDSLSNLRLRCITPPHPQPGNPDYDWNDPVLNSWTDSGILAGGVMAAEIKIALLDDAVLPQLLCVWTDGAALRYVLTDLKAMTNAGSTMLTQNPQGRYHDLRIVPQSNLTARVLARFSGLTYEVRQFVINAASGVTVTDVDGDGLNDLIELNIVDASTNDTILTIREVQPGDDFDQDHYSNGLEIEAGSDPTDARSLPPLEGVHVVADLARAYERDQMPGCFTITRADSDTAVNPLTVGFVLSGTATVIADYETLGSCVVIPAHERSVSIDVIPVTDGLPEGDETVEMRLLPNVNYALGHRTNAAVSIVDEPYDAWRHGHFTGTQLEDPTVSGDLADPDADGTPNLLEFGMSMNPQLPETPPFRIEVIREGDSLDCYLIFERNYDAHDGLFLLEATDDIEDDSWEDVTALLSVLAREAGISNEQVILQDHRQLGEAPRRFYRLRFNR